jgi:hypothetical protein
MHRMYRVAEKRPFQTANSMWQKAINMDLVRLRGELVKWRPSMLAVLTFGLCYGNVD